MTMTQKIEAMVQWAKDHMGKIPGPVKIRGGVITNPDKYLETQILTMGAYKPRDLMHTAAYMRIYQLKSIIENQ